MRLSLFRLALVAGLVLLAQGSAWAQNDSPQQLQALIASGQEQQALGQLANVIKQHPNSGVAWYLVAEAEDAKGDPSAARSALAKADQLAPGLPFAQPDKVAALRAHLASNSGSGSNAPFTATAPAATAGAGIGPVALVIGAIVVLFIVVRMFLRSRRRSMVPAGYRGGFGPNAAPPGTPYPYNPGGMPYGGGGMMGGAGSSLLGGLAAGAGFVAGERILGDLTGGGGGLGGNGNANADPNSDPMPPPERDDGLTGNPGWDDGDGGGGDTSNNDNNFDPGNNW